MSILLQIIFLDYKCKDCGHYPRGDYEHLKGGLINNIPAFLVLTSRQEGNNNICIRILLLPKTQHYDEG